jgi:hypothetical protein
MANVKLLTKAIASKVPALYSQDGKGMEAIAYAKFFTPWSNWTWYLTEMDPATGQCFGLQCFGPVVGRGRELGHFNLKELEATRGPAGLRIERDIHFDPTPLSQCS